MPGFVLHLGAQIQCAHGGLATPTAPSPSVLVSGQPVTTIACPYVVAGCAFPPPPLANGPCITAQYVSASLSVMSNGQPLLLLDSQAICAPTGTPLLPATVTQTRVIAR